MKDKKITEKLNIYADALPRNERILYGAYYTMDAKRQMGAYNRRKSGSRRLGWGLAAAAVVFALVIGIILNSRGKSSAGTQVYSLDSLQIQTVSANEFYALNGVLYLDESEQISGKYYVYVNQKKEVYAARAVYRAVRGSGVDQIIIISDLKNNLSDYSNDKPTEYYPTVRNFDEYINGEYYSFLAALRGNTTYYIMIESPTMQAGAFYENILF